VRIYGRIPGELAGGWEAFSVTMRAGSDEAVFAGLLLLTKCSRETVSKIAPSAANVLLGNHSPGAKSTSNFLRRLLITKKESIEDVSDCQSLSNMQILGLNITSTLSQCGLRPVRLQLATSLGSTVSDLLRALVDVPSSTESLERGSTSGLVEVLECLSSMLCDCGNGVNSLADYTASTLMPALIQILRRCRFDLDELSRMEQLSSEPTAQDEEHDRKGVGPDELKVASLALSLAREVAERASLCVENSSLIGAWVRAMEVAVSLADGVMVNSSNHRGSWSPSARGCTGADEGEGRAQVAAQRKRPFSVHVNTCSLNLTLVRHCSGGHGP
jgi:hypothetical protein